VHELKAGGVLFAAGDAGDGCYRLDQGLLKVMVASTSGEERIVAQRMLDCALLAAPTTCIALKALNATCPKRTLWGRDSGMKGY